MIILLNPINVKDGYIFNTGWVSSDENIDTPNLETKWKIAGNKKLSPNNPISIFYENDQAFVEATSKRFKIQESSIGILILPSIGIHMLLHTPKL